MSSPLRALAPAEHALLPPGLGFLDDRLNPVLVKEVRQALRGRFFVITYLGTLVFATFMAMLVVAGASDGARALGLDLFQAEYAVLAIAVHVLVPFFAFTSMGSEWEDGAFDLLVLSDLRPGQVVRGKVFAALVQASLFYSAFGPFLVFAWLLKGLDLLALFVVLGLSMGLTALLASVAVAFSSLTHRRYQRIALLAVLTAGLFMTAMASINIAGYLMRAADELRGSEAWTVVGGTTLAGLVVGSFAYALATSRLAHTEENRSTGLRILTSVAVVATAAFCVLLDRMTPLTSTSFAAMALAVWGVLVHALPGILFCGEPETLGRRVRSQVPDNPFAALILAPYLPGGGRGLLLFFLHGALVIVGVGALGGLPTATGERALAMAFALSGYAFVFIGIPTGLLSRFSANLGMRILGRLAVPLLFILSILLPGFLSFFLGGGGFQEFSHPFNPVSVLIDIGEDDLSSARSGLVVLGVAVLAVLLLNTPRILRSLLEVLAVSRQRRLDAKAKRAAA